MVKLQNINFKYNDKELFNQFNLSLEDHKIYSLLGKSGIGKTTLLKLVAKVVTPNAGTVEMEKTDQISFIFQEPTLIEEITVFQNLDFILQPIYPDKEQRKQKIEEGLASVDMANTGKLYPNQLSKSMQHRIGMLRAFLYPSTILLMDEPFNGLDIGLKYQMIDLFIKLWKEKKQTVLFISHDIDEGLLISDHILLLGANPFNVVKSIDISKEKKEGRNITKQKYSKIKADIIKYLKQ